MNFLSESLFQAVFNTSVPRVIVKNDAPDFTVVAGNDAQQQISPTGNNTMHTTTVWEAFNFGIAEEGNRLLLMNTLINAAASNSVLITPAFKHAIYIADNDKQAANWLQIEVKPVIDSTRQKAEYLLLTTFYVDRPDNYIAAAEQAEAQGHKPSTRLAESNKEIATSNKALTSVNKELIRSQAGLQPSNNKLEQHVQLRTQALAESEASFRNLVQSAPIAIIVLRGPDMIVELANDKMLQLWNKPATITGKRLLKIHPEMVKNPVFKILQRVYTSGKIHSAYEIKGMVQRDGKSVEGYYDAIYQPIKTRDGAVTGLMAVITDVTEQVSAKPELDRAYEQTRLAKQAAQLGMFDMDLLKGTMEWDNRCRTLFGISHNDQVSYEKDFLPGLHPDDKERVSRIIDAAFNKSLSGGDYDVEYRTIGAEDKKERWVRAKGKVFFDEENTPVRFIGSVLEITEQKKDEQRKNDFIGIVSHELRTPLTSIKAYIQLLKKKTEQESDTNNVILLSKAENQVNKMTAMIKGFLDVSRLEAGKIHLEKESFIINTIIEEVIADVVAITPGYAISFLPCSPLSVCADREKINHVIYNILNNAIKYSPPGSSIRVTCMQAKNMITVSIADQGIGVAKEDLDKLFDRYYRVQNPQMKTISGFGIGLYLSAEIVKRHNGKIWVESQEGKGATFYFSLPDACW